jgi:H+-translocating NAD(P) transhydrogenase subunit alpha
MEAPEDQQETVTVGVPRETVSGERRVALVPETIQKLSSTGTKVVVEAGAGQGAFFDDEAYRTAGAEVVDGADAIFTRSDIVAKVQAPTETEIEKIRPGAVLISFLDRGRDAEIIDALGKRASPALSLWMPCPP